MAELSEELKLKIKQRWEDTDKPPPSLKELAQICYGTDIDGRDFRMRQIKEFCVSLNYKVSNMMEIRKSKILEKKIELTQEQKEYIANNCASMSSLEMAHVLFGNKNLGAFSREARAVRAYMESLPNKVFFAQEENIVEDTYSPPKTIIAAAKRTNKYILECINLDELEKSTKLQNWMKSLIKFCHMYRFQMIMNNFVSKADRELFEASYIRHCYNCPDYLESDLDILCNICSDIVTFTNLQKDLESLKKIKNECLDDSEGKKISMTIVEDMKNLRKELDENQKRQNTAFKALQGTRNQRMDLRLKEVASVLNLMESWRDEKERKRLLKFAEDRKKMCREELQKQDTMEDYLSEIYGINKESFE